MYRSNTPNSDGIYNVFRIGTEDLIGHSNSSGISTKPHAHYETYKFSAQDKNGVFHREAQTMSNNHVKIKDIKSE